MKTVKSLENCDDVLRPEDIQHVLHIGRNTVYSYLAKGIIKSIRIGKQYRIPKQYLVDFIYSGNSINLQGDT